MLPQWSEARLAVVEAGVQPVVGDRLVCRLCGRLFRSLGHHLVGPRHRAALEDYRERFELPASMPLMAADLREKHAAAGRELLETNAEVRAAFAVDERDSQERDRRRRRGLQRKAQTESRAGVQRSKRSVGTSLGQHSRQRAADVRAELNDRARGHGFPDLPALLQATTGLTASELARLLGCTPSSAAAWRRKNGVRSTSAQAAAAARAANHRVAVADQAAGASGTQPVADSGWPICLECGQAWRDLIPHLQGRHRLDVVSYRRRHRLADGALLRERVLDGQLRSATARVGRTAGVAHQRRARSRYDQLAQQAGYHDVADLLAVADNRQVSDLLGISMSQAIKVRGRYLPGSHDVGQARIARTRRRHDDAAKSAGYTDVVELLRAVPIGQAQAVLGLGHRQTQILIQRYLAVPVSSPAAGVVTTV